MKPNLKKYVLDTSAMLAFFLNEDGGIEVQNLIMETVDSPIHLTLSLVSCIELFYIIKRRLGTQKAEYYLYEIETLPIHIENLSQAQIQTIGDIKSNHRLSFADACIAGLASILDAVLVHKDPEFDQLDGKIEQLKLPYNAKQK